jgi:hypothetical protein
MPVNNATISNRIAGLRGRRTRIAFTACFIVILASCSTTKETADAGDAGATEAAAADAKGATAKNGAKPSGKYVDPMVSTTARRTQGADRIPAGGTANAAGLPEGTMPQAPPSISGLATQPTGVRAGNFSIFSSPTAPAAPPTNDGASASAEAATGSAPQSGHMNAATRSVFSAQPANCGADANGVPLSC